MSLSVSHRPPHGGYPGTSLERGSCHFCGLSIGSQEKAIESNNTPGVWAHVTCWYDGGPFEREQRARAAR